MSDTEFGDLSMLELFQMEEQQQSALLSEGLLSLEQEPLAPKTLESLMRASHSLKGAARMVGIDPVVDITHIMEDCFVAAQNNKLVLNSDHIDILFKSVDLISQIANSLQELPQWLGTNQNKVNSIQRHLKSILASDEECSKQQVDVGFEKKSGHGESLGSSDNGAQINKADSKPQVAEKSDLRIDSLQIDRLMRLAGEASEGSRWIRKHSESLLQLKRKQFELFAAIDHVTGLAMDDLNNGQIQERLHDIQLMASDCRSLLGDRLNSLDGFERKNISVSKRLSQAVITSRMQPFGDCIAGFPRLVRDVARKLDKNVKLEIEGKGTLVDREVLSKIEAPLNHLLRNAIDHGIESAGIREALGKTDTGTIRLSAYHMSGMLFITVTDDGQGVDIDGLRKKIIKNGLVHDDLPQMLSDEELLEFMFLPSFSTRDEVTEISGRGVGLDVVFDAVKEMGGMIHTFSTYGEGTTFQLQLPLTLSVIPSLLVKIGGEPYAFPLARIDSVYSVDASDIKAVDGHQFLDIEGKNIGLIAASQVLNLCADHSSNDTVSVVTISNRSSSYGLVVDECFGEQSLIVQMLPKKIGKLKDISAAAILENGISILILDMDDMLRSVEKIISTGLIKDIENRASHDYLSNRKRILVIDDSITVREVERNMLESSGYDVDVAVDGMDGWHMIHQYNFDLIITDIDMPRMDGIELICKIKSKGCYKNIPIIVVSYKDREEDRERVFSAGADQYLTKGSFQDNSLREAVEGLIGEATA
ncbi:MAG: hybrid sensor histidine kinase/response regulator [Candidatus Polarisedimenticolaceae bacterium]|nr:hybrid sensor histidine kinase/response regulator [Candidatus Polarisedimenticolaceae bacterium]